MKNNTVGVYFRKLSVSAFLYTVALCLLVAVAVSGQVAADQCDHAELMRCALPLRVLTDNKELGFVARKEELDELCPNMNTGLRCIDSYTRRCMTPPKRAEFNRLYSGTSQVIQDLCKEGPYQEEFLQHAPCMRLVKSEYEDCATHYTEMIQDVSSPAKVNRSQQGSHHHAADGNSQMRTVCCSFQDYLTCSENIVMKQCGEATANFTQGFLNRMSSSLITHHCREYLPGCSDAVSGAYNSSAVRIANWLLLLLANCLVLFAHAGLTPRVLSG